MRATFFTCAVLLFHALCYMQNLSTDQIYKKAWETAMADSVISVEEHALLNTLFEALSLSEDSTTVVVKTYPTETEDVLDQSGRWPLVLQNMVIGSGLYGWAIPYAFDAKDFRWYAGTEMLSLGGAFYLTYKYTKEMQISHAKAQMMRYGGLVGLRYGAGINTIFDLYNDEDTYDDETDSHIEPKRRKAWALILMASVPAGIYGGDYLFNKLQPTNGQAWVLTQWTAIGGVSCRAITYFFDPDPNYNEDNEEEANYDDEEYEQRQKEYETWNKRHTSIELLVGYPLGFYFGKKLTMDKNYSFGDALMLYQGYSYGFFNSMMLQGILLDKFNERSWILLNTIGAVGSMFAYDRWIAGQDFSAGQSILMALGSVSGTAFGFGVAIILDINEKEPMLSMALAGYGAGTYFTRKIINSHPDGSLANNDGMNISFLPTVIPAYKKNNTVLIPGIAFHLEF
ncbi:MAG: TerB family tellurite resistance protein [Candidatus Marinimicrobia bacterium]|nr:TerB family tellurite resistance protein [Candidatus Neomarinimicrobiota bacterium]